MARYHPHQMIPAQYLKATPQDGAIEPCEQTPLSLAASGSRLLIASSRLPLSVSRQQGAIIDSNGGVASALRSVHNRCRDLWIGAVAQSELEAAITLGWSERLRSLRASAVELSDAEMADFYGRY